MAALNRPTKASYVLHENVTIDTADNEDHTFCGVVFPIECKSALPVDHIVVNGISVRGMLGHLSVWLSNNDQEICVSNDTEASGEGISSIYRRASRRSAGARMSAISVESENWAKVYEKRHPPSMKTYQELKLDIPLTLRPGEVRGVYVHSSRSGDESIVYDNQKGPFTHDDKFIRIRPGLAHLSSTAFGHSPPWGYGSAWRERREFVGRISYGVVYKLWNPSEYFTFGSNFQNAARTLFGCQRRFESPMARLPDDVLFYVLNMCRWDWFNDNAKHLLERVPTEDTVDTADSETGDEELDTEAEHAGRRATRLRRSWARRSQLSLLAHLRRGVLLETLGLGSRNDIFVVNHGNDDDGNDDDDADDQSWNLDDHIGEESDDDEEWHEESE